VGWKHLERKLLPRSGINFGLPNWQHSVLTTRPSTQPEIVPLNLHCGHMTQAITAEKHIHQKDHIKDKI